MPRAKKDAGVPLIYVDSCVYLDLIVKNPQTDPATGEARWRGAMTVFGAAKSGQIRLAASSLLEAEVTCNGEARSESPRVQELLRGWFHSKSTAWTDVDRFLARDAARLAKDYSPKRLNKDKRFASADALHLAAAVRLRCDYFFSHDGGFPIGHTVGDVQVQTPDVVWQESLFDRQTSA